MYEITYLDLAEDKSYDKIVEKVLQKCYEEEKLLDSKLIITITFTTPEQIHKINKEYRQVDRPTDVLSFPMFERKELEEKIAKQEKKD